MFDFFPPGKPGIHDQKRSMLVSSLSRFAYLSQSPHVRALFAAAALAFFICLSGASNAHACAVDSVAAKTHTTITIGWDARNCKKFEKFRICWKKAGNEGAACNGPDITSASQNGSATITGLSPNTAYKIKTDWHRKISWYDVMTRVVTTNPPPVAPVEPLDPTIGYGNIGNAVLYPRDTTLRYVKESARNYCVTFYWKALPPPPQNKKLTPSLIVNRRFFGDFLSFMQYDVTDISLNSNDEYSLRKCDFMNAFRYEAYISWDGGKSNKIEWK